MEQRSRQRRLISLSGCMVMLMVGSGVGLAQNPADHAETLEQAKRAVRLRNYPQAVSLFTILAQQGDVDAQYQLG